LVERFVNSRRFVRFAGGRQLGRTVQQPVVDLGGQRAGGCRTGLAQGTHCILATEQSQRPRGGQRHVRIGGTQQADTVRLGRLMPPVAQGVENAGL
jgi:hypothetical protein